MSHDFGVMSKNFLPRLVPQNIEVINKKKAHHIIINLLKVSDMEKNLKRS